MLRSVRGRLGVQSVALVCILMTCCVTLTVTVDSTAFADQATAEVINAKGSSVPGCEKSMECFIPHTVTIDVGGEVTWPNVDVAAHTVISGTPESGSDGVFDSGLFPPGAEFSHIFEEAGEYPYFCLVHPWMEGLVVVQSSVVDSGQDVGLDYLTGNTVVVLHTEMGRLTIELFPDDAPNHTANFMSLAEDGFYDGTVFHRIIPGFIIQGGDPHTRPGFDMPRSHWGTGGPGTTIDAEFNDIMHDRGIVSMARASDPDSAGSQFFILHDDAHFLDGQYTVFGRLATQESYDTLDAIASISTDPDDRPIHPHLVRITSVDVLSGYQAAISGIKLLDQGPPKRVQPTAPIPSHPERVSPATTGLRDPEDQVYTNAKLNISITLPRGWVIQDTGDENTLLVTDPRAGSTVHPFMAVSMISVPGITIDDVAGGEAEQAIFARLSEEGTFEILQQQRTTVNGMPAFVADAVVHPDNDVGNMAIKYRAVIVVSTDTAHILVFGSSLGSFDADLPLFEESLHSFEVLEGYADDDPVSFSDVMSLFATLMVLAMLTAGTEGALIAEYGVAHPIYTVTSGSMRPALAVGDLIVISALVRFEGIEPGDIIVYNRPSDHDRVIVHRVVSVTDDNPHTLKAKGDANPSSIYGTDFPITEDDYIGKVINVIRHHDASEISSDGDPFLGLAGAPIDIIVFSDFQCPSCIRFHTATLPALTDLYLDTGLARLIYRDFPDRHTYPNAVNAAAAAECAGDQNMYWEYHHMLSDRASEWGSLSQTRALAQFESYAETIDLDRSDFLKCMNSSKYIPEVISDYADGIAYGVDAAPTLFVGNTHAGYYQISGSRSYAEIQAIIHYVLSTTILDGATPSGDTADRTTPPMNLPSQIDKSGFRLAPDIVGIAEYINTTPHRLDAAIKDSVVMYNIWTYSNINSIRILPFIKAWDAKYSDQGLLIVGIHTPEFGFETDPDNVRAAIAKHSIEYPVVMDNDLDTWNAFENRYWPRTYLVDHEGYIRYDHIGEGAYLEAERAIQQLLSERAAALDEAIVIDAGLVELDVFQHTRDRTPELHLGYQMASGRQQIGNSEGFRPNTPVLYEAPANKEPHMFYMDGVWINGPESMQLISDEGAIELIYYAKEVNIVTKGSGTMEVYVDGRPISKSLQGDDVLGHTLTVSEPGLYNIVNSESASTHEIRLHVLTPGMEVFTFSFG